MTAHFKPGDAVIYRKQKFSLRPSPQAKDICPAAYGDYYSYSVDKFWRVIAVRANQQIVVCTRRGKELTLEADDPALRRASWWERFVFRHRFPTGAYDSRYHASGQSEAAAATTPGGKRTKSRPLLF
jgi:hypothetical protein